MASHSNDLSNQALDHQRNEIASCPWGVPIRVPPPLVGRVGILTHLAFTELPQGAGSPKTVSQTSHKIPQPREL